MALALQVGMALVIGLGVSMAVSSDRRPRLDRVAMAIAIAGAGLILFAGHVIGHLRTFHDEREALAGVSAFEAETAPGADNGQNVAFLRWAKRQMEAGDTFAILPADLYQRVDQFIPYQWSTFQLTPHQSVAAADADWLVFYGTSAARQTYDHRAFPDVHEHSPGYAVARRADAD